MSNYRIRGVLLLAGFFGWLGVHRFYVGKIGTGLLMLLTVGGFGIWIVIDLILILCSAFTDADGRAITLWSDEPPSGSPKRVCPLLLLHHFLDIFGVHRFYAGKILTGMLMLCTLGGFGILWVIDWFLIVTNSFPDADGRTINEWL